MEISSPIPNKATTPPFPHNHTPESLTQHDIYSYNTHAYEDGEGSGIILKTKAKTIM
ncbi:protein furry isoform X4 [Sesbania bispinosa]|nr:protein furry isoform X4 [Sesbania bispinosa]